MSIAKSLETLSERFAPSAPMPAVFLGHGNPMNAIQTNEYTEAWAELGRSLPRPKAILVVSAHWMTRGTTLVDVSEMPRTIYDFHGFPDEMYNLTYDAPGDPTLARDVVDLLKNHHGEEDDRWGLDHGSWTILKYMYPQADVPVFQVSIDMTKDLPWHLEIGEKLAELRNRGVLILGSGNLVHNLRRMRFHGAPEDFAVDFDGFVADRLEQRDFQALTDRKGFGSLLRAAHPSVDHYLPALTIAGASTAQDTLSFMTDRIDMGSISMRSFVFHNA